MDDTRIDKDRKALEAIGRIYCAAHHAGGKDATGLWLKVARSGLTVIFR